MQQSSWRDGVAPDENGTIKLHYTVQSWDAVLEHFAEQAGMELVADRVPGGRYSRTDYKKYSIKDSMKILNRELEPLGYRLIKKTNYLVLIETSNARLEYQRPETGSNSKPKGRNEQLVPINYEEEEVEEAEEPEESPKPRVKPRTPRPRSNKTAAEIVDEFELNAESLSEKPTPKTLDQTPVSLTVNLKVQTAREVANVVYQAFKSQSRLLEDGPEGLPGFIVESSLDKAGKPAMWFSVGIDEDRNELVVNGPQAAAQSTAELFKKLDRPKKSNTTRRVIPTSNARQVANELKPAVETLVEASLEEADNLLANNQPEGTETKSETTPDEVRIQPKEETAPVPGVVPGSIQGVKGPVTIEAIPDLNVLIVQGAQQDVEAVMAIIREIQKLSKGTAPQVQVLPLKHSDSQSLAELLTTVYERLGTMRGRTVQQTSSATFYPVVKPNAILIIASAVDMDAIKKLAEELDQPVDPEGEFYVFRLKSGVATQVVDLITQFYEEREGLGPRIRAYSDLRTNSVVIYARPRDMEEVRALIKKLDRADSASASRLEIVALKHAIAEEMASVLSEAIQAAINPPRQPGTQGGNQFNTGAAGQAPQELRDTRGTIIQFLVNDQEGQRLIKSGLLSDIRISSDARTNSLLLTAPEASIQLLVELIKVLDQPAKTVAEIKIFPLQNADAQTMAELLQNLFDQQQNQQGGNQNQGQSQLGIQLAGAEDATSGLVPLRFSFDTRTNSVLAIGGADALVVVESMLIRLDQGDVRERQTVVYRVKNSPSDDIQAAIETFLTTRRDLAQTADGLVSAFEQLEREVIVVSEPVSNSLIISSTPRYFKEIKDLVVKLDEPPSQVIIQALLVEVSLDNTDEFGVELGFQDSILFDRSVIDELQTINETTTLPNGTQTTTQRIISQTAVPGFLFNNQQLGNNTAVRPSHVGSQGLSSFSLGRINNELGYGGLVLSAGSESVSVLLRALAARRRVDILSRPQIRTLENNIGQIQVGQIVSVVNGVTQSGQGIVQPNVRQDNAGIILQVQPRISPDGAVVMNVHAERSQYQPSDSGTPIFTDVTSGQVIRAPIKDVTIAEATVSVRNGQTVVFGGMITRNGSRVERKVPFFGDIPILGIPFRYDLTESARTELLVFLTPRVLKSDEDEEMIKQIELERIHFLEEEAEEMHGPIREAPPPVEYQPSEEDMSEIPTTTMPGQFYPPPAPGGEKVEQMNYTDLPRNGLSKRKGKPLSSGLSNSRE